MTTPASLVFTSNSSSVHVTGAGRLQFFPDPPAPGRPTFGKPFPSPFTDGTHKAVVHFQASCYEYGGGWDGLGLVSGYSQSAENIAELGFDAIAFDTGGDNAPYPGNITNLFAGLSLRNAANAGKVNALGVGDMKAYILFDMATFPEDAGGQEAMASLFLAHCRDPAYFTYQGRPVFSTYVGEGGGWANVKSVFGAALTSIRAAGVNPFILPGFIPTDINGTYIDRANPASVSAWVAGEIKGFADGAWQYPSGACPLGVGSGIPGDEACSAGIAAIGLPYMRGVMPHYWGSAHITANGDLRFLEEFRGGEGLAAYMKSALRDANAKFVQCATYNDFDEGSYCSPVDPNLLWPYLRHGRTPGFYPSKAGLGKEIQYWLTWYKAGQEPLIADDTLIYYVRPQTANVVLTATDPYGPITQVDNADSDPPGVLQDLLFVTAIVKGSGYVQAQFLDASNVPIPGSGWTRFVTPGINHISGPFVAGTPILTLLRDRQSVLVLTAPPIVSSAAEINANYMTGFNTV